MQIEGLRGISIIIVVVYHFFCRYFQLFCDDDVAVLHYFGTIGVGFFILISGYYLIPVKKEERQFCFFDFIRKKVIRLWPLYFISVTIIFIVLQIWQLPGRETGLLDYCLNITLLNGYIGTPYVDGAHWYMTTLFALILIIGLARKLHIAHHPIFYLGWMAAVLILHFVGWNQLCTDVGGGYVGYVSIAYGMKCIANNNSKMKRLSCVCCALGGAGAVYFIIGKIPAVELIVIVPIVYLCLNTKLAVLEFRVFGFIGKISYALYLIHQNIGYLIILSFMKINNQYEALYGIFALIVSFVLAVAVNSMNELLMRKMHHHH